MIRVFYTSKKYEIITYTDEILKHENGEIMNPCTFSYVIEGIYSFVFNFSKRPVIYGFKIIYHSVCMIEIILRYF